jgi:hypothetical protein
MERQMAREQYYIWMKEMGATESEMFTAKAEEFFTNMFIPGGWFETAIMAVSPLGAFKGARIQANAQRSPLQFSNRPPTRLAPSQSPSGSTRIGGNQSVPTPPRGVTPQITPKLPATTTNQTPPNSGTANTATSSDLVDILSPKARQHILHGDGPGSGGHLWPGQPGKTAFPQSWSEQQIVHQIGEIVTSPQTKWFAQTGGGNLFTRSGNPARWRSWEIRDGVRTRVVYEPATGQVVTAFPDSGPVSGTPIK